MKQSIRKQKLGLNTIEEEKSITLSITEQLRTADNLSGQIYFINDEINISPPVQPPVHFLLTLTGNLDCNISEQTSLTGELEL